MATSDLRANPAAAAQAIQQAAVFYQQGRLDEAEKICTRVLKARPDWFDALHLLGVVRLQRGKAGGAQALLESALKLNPNSAEVWSNLGLALAALNRDAEALAAFDKAMALKTGNIDALNNRGNMLLKMRRFTDALADFEQAVRLEPRFLGARVNRGNALAQLQRFDEALAEFDAVLTAQPSHAETHYNRGNVLAALSRHEEAIAAYDRALALKPNTIVAITNRGISLQALNRYQEAIVASDQVLAIDKANADAHHNRALARLTLGDFRGGFEDYEWRWRRSGMSGNRRFNKPLWLGEYPLGRKTLLVHAEQGLGDTIQFVRYVPLLARTGAKVVLEAPRELVSLLSRVEGAATVVARGEALPPFDLHCPAGSLARALRTEAATIPADIPYLEASPEHVAKWAARIETLPKPRIAVAWAGSADHVNDRNRSIALGRLAPLFEHRGASFLGIQRDLRSDDTATLATLPQVTHLGGELNDFDDTAAVVSLADLAISVDTSVVHLAGALGRPTFVLLPFNPDWRWMLDRTDSPWYPTLRLFRQPKFGDWDSVIARVREELPAFV